MLTAYEDDDELYCQKLYHDYLEDTDPDKDETFTLDECKKEWKKEKVDIESVVQSLIGAIPDTNMSLEELREERRSKRYYENGISQYKL